MMNCILWLLAGYIAGSLPTSYLVARWLRGIDIREHGSGNPGATNVFRVVGPVPGIVTFLVDALKGFLPVHLAAGYFGPVRPGWAIAVGLAAIAGHMWTVFLGFRGGKGVATAAGVFAALLPVPALIAFGVFCATLALTRYVSLGSMLGALTLSLTAWIGGSPAPFAWCATAVGGLVIVKHQSNIKKLLAGTEHKLGKKS